MEERYLRGLKVARRFYLPRTLGLGLGFLAVAAVFYENRAHSLAWAALAAHGFLWPHVAYALARRSADPTTPNSATCWPTRRWAASGSC